jgi:hypothetical protein
MEEPFVSRTGRVSFPFITIFDVRSPSKEEVEEVQKLVQSEPNQNGIKVLSVMWGLGKPRNDGSQDTCFVISKGYEQRFVEEFLKRKVGYLAHSGMNTYLVTQSAGFEW